MRFPDWFLSEVRERVSIAHYAGKRLTWDKRKTQPGKGDYWAPCPFHTEKSASFHVKDREGYFHCFGCGEKGDVFTLCRKLEGLNFAEAIERLASEAGMRLPEASPEDQRRSDRRGRLLAASARAAKLFQTALAGPDARKARQYLEGRGLGDDVCAQFGLGFAPDSWTWSIEALQKEGYQKQELIDAGLARAGGRDGAIDAFRNRIMFPIADSQGRVIAFGGRTLSPDEPAKYVNSAETDLFHKGKNLYRLKEARELLAKTKAQGLVVGEGYLDVVAFERAGIAAVAPLGTALTEDQLELIWKCGGEPIFCFDGDAAGQRAAAKALDMALPHVGPGKTLKFARLPDKLDPDDVYRRFGPDGVRAILDDTVSALDALFEREKGARALESPEARADLKARLAAAAAKIAHPETRREYERALRDRTYQLFAPVKRAWTQGGAKGGKGAPWERDSALTPELKALARSQRRLVEEHMVRVPVDYPDVLRAGSDLFAEAPIQDPDLDRIRHATLDLWMQRKMVDRDALCHHLLSVGAESACQRIQFWPKRIVRKPREDEAGEGSAASVGGSEPAQLGVGEVQESPAGQSIEAEWMAFLALDISRPQLRQEMEDAARERDLDADEDAFRAAWEAGRAGKALLETALRRGEAQSMPTKRDGRA